MGKKDRRKEYITSFTYVAHVASLKILHEKTQWKKTHQGKKSTIVDIGSVLRDRHVIFWITVMGYRIQDSSPPELCNSLSRLMPIPRTHLLKLEAGRDFVNKSARFSHDLALLELVWVKEFRSNMLGEIALNIAHMHLCNTSCIILIDNGGGVNSIHTT